MKVYHQRLCCGKPNKNEVLSLSQHTLKDGSSKKKKKKKKDGSSEPAPRTGRSAPQRLPRGKGTDMWKEADRQQSWRQWLWLHVRYSVPTSLHLRLLDRRREGGLSSFSCWLSHVRTSLGTSFTLPRGLIKSHYPQDSDIPPWEDKLEIPEAVSHCFCCEYVMSFKFWEPLCQ